MADTLERLMEEPGPEQPGTRRARSARRKAGKRRRGAGNAVLTVLGVGLLIGGLALGAGTLFAPQAVEQAYGAVKVGVADRVQQVQQEVFEELPTVSLGVSGGQAELDLCDGTFTEMLSYEREGVPPVWAAHNNCGGDVILPWEIGQRLRVAGSDQVYEIVDITYTSKIWSSTADLVGLEGELALQSCFYGEDRMKFIGLEPVDS
ncbi:hypothetical protein N8K70_00055 [Microbacterium betulae]|uniref:Sortase n=1 Tax=Microbacterium betulae TaxID=2981139 RepID=A0AA97FHH3_9MICO|nr:hypothetical protein [Microbacterium sp. AB]WOF23095.1 hypothetical protein N8K70_00055 [Microbacterium sp. AB]